MPEQAEDTVSTATDTPDELSLPSQEKGSELVRTLDKPDLESGNPEGSDSESDPDTFPRSYVEELRQENGKYRQRAQQADTYAQRLHTELVRSTGRLADPTDLPYVEDHLADADKMVGAIDELLVRKPHLASRKPYGEIGQGTAPSAGSVDLAAILRQRTG